MLGYGSSLAPATKALSHLVIVALREPPTKE